MLLERPSREIVKFDGISLFVMHRLPARTKSIVMFGMHGLATKAGSPLVHPGMVFGMAWIPTIAGRPFDWCLMFVLHLLPANATMYCALSASTTAYGLPVRAATRRS